jgi:ABC-type lipoprotein export system ATPase subunit
MQVAVEDITAMFGGRVVLKVGHATFQSGAISGIIGPSGSGKSTLLSIIAGFLQPATGKVEYRDGGRLGPPTMSDISWVPQGAYLLPDRTVLDNVALGALSVGLELAVAKFTALRALEKVGLEDRGRDLASNLSGGEAQRVALARAICAPRPIILADEPTASLDRQSAGPVANILRNMPSDRLVIVATHDPLLIERCDQILDLGVS